MKAGAGQYHLLDQQDCDEIILHKSDRTSCLFRKPSYTKAFFLACLVSASFNVWYLIRSIHPTKLDRTLKDIGVTKFAGLQFDTPVPDEHGGRYNDVDNEALTNEAWDELGYDDGSIALDYEYAKMMGLPKAQPFPWDSTKGIYFINGYHGLHCLKLMRHSMLALRDGHPLKWDWEHNMHCFNSLRQDILCAADDTPRYTSYEHPGTIGVGQPRQCRNWQKLETWAKERTACWRDINPTDSIDTLLRFRYCPEGSPYHKWIHAIFGSFETGKNASAWN